MPVQNRAYEIAHKLALRLKQAWSHEANHAVVLAHVVLERRARKDHPPTRADVCKCLRQPRLSVAQHMTLVTDDHIGTRVHQPPPNNIFLLLDLG